MTVRPFIILASILLLPAAALAAPGGLAEQGAFESDGFAGGIFVEAICDLYGLVGGSLGALLTTTALLTGLIAAAVGGFSDTRGAVIVAVACFGFTSGVSLYFGSFDCAAPAQQLPATGGQFGEIDAEGLV